MKSKITIPANPVPVYDYPKLMYCLSDKSLVVLFTAPKVGTVVNCRNADERHRVGSHQYEWNEIDFRDFIGVVELENTPVTV